jgi:AcrR family transcriptional regulator
MDAGANEQLRRTLQGSTDPRVTRTRTRLTAAVHQLSAEGEGLNVASITRAAGVSRASFYAHYASLDELADSIRRDAFVAIADFYQHHDRADAMHASQERLVVHFASNRALYVAVSGLTATKEGYLSGVRVMATLIEESLRSHPARPPQLDAEVTARYIAGAAYGLLDAWTTGEIVLGEEELADHLTRLLPSWFSGVR